MHKDLDPRDGLETPRTPKAEPTDHELAPTGRISDAVHAWLDGEPVAEAALSAAPREVAFWKKVEGETSVRRRMVTPAHVPAQILAKLPDKG
jgi:hypothetical protein